jgi:hypothetical protein
VLDNGGEPFVSLTTECQLEVGKSWDVIPFVGDLTIVDASHEFESHDCIFGQIAVEIQQLNDLSFHGDVGIGLNLPCKLSSVIVTLNDWLVLTHILLVETRAYSNRIWWGDRHHVFEEILVEVVERELVNAFVCFRFGKSLFVSL